MLLTSVYELLHTNSNSNITSTSKSKFYQLLTIDCELHTGRFCVLFLMFLVPLCPFSCSTAALLILHFFLYFLTENLSNPKISSVRATFNILLPPRIPMIKPANYSHAFQNDWISSAQWYGFEMDTVFSRRPSDSWNTQCQYSSAYLRKCSSITMHFIAPRIKAAGFSKSVEKDYTDYNTINLHSDWW